MRPRWPYDAALPKRTCVSLKFARWRDVTLGKDNGTDGQTDRRADRRTDRRTDRVRRNMRPPPREEGHIIK